MSNNAEDDQQIKRIKQCRVCPTMLNVMLSVSNNAESTEQRNKHVI